MWGAAVTTEEEVIRTEAPTSWDIGTEGQADSSNKGTVIGKGEKKT